MAARKLAARLALLVGSVLLALVLAEGALRAYFWSRGVGRGEVAELLRRAGDEPAAEVDTNAIRDLVRASRHPDLVYELRPNLRGRFRGRPLRVNALGLRGGECEVAKAPGVRRIVGLGDSHMFGWAVAEGETFLERLEERLKREAPGPWRYEALNFAAPGYNTAMEVAMYEHRARFFAPDLVVIHFVANDLRLPHLLRPPRGLEPSDWYLVEIARSVLGREGEGELALLRPGPSRPARRAHLRARERYGWMKGERGYRRAMAKLARLAARDAVPVIVLVLGDWPLVREVAAEQGLRVVDAMPHFIARLEREGIAVTAESFRQAFNVAGERHPSPLAHAAYADALYGELEASGFLAAGEAAVRD